MSSLIWTAEGGVSGVTVSTGNSGGASGDAWDSVQVGAGATNQYSSHALVGLTSLLIATGASSVQSYVQWQVSVAARWPSGMTTEYGRCYIEVPALPAADRTFVELLAADGTTKRADLRVRSTGALRIRNAANGTVTTTTTILSLNTRYRVEWRVDGSVTGAWSLRLFLGDSAVAIETLSGTDNFGGAIGTIRFGQVVNGANSPAIYLDAIEINDTGLPGPAVYAAVCPGRWRGALAGGGNIPAFRLTDDFADGVVDTSQWTQFAFGSVTGSETGGTYTFAVTTAGGGGAQLLSQSRHDLTGGSFATELISAGVQEAGLQAYPVEVQIDSNNRIFMVIGNGFIGAYQVVGGVTTDHGFTAYDSTLHRWFRIRESAGTTFWEVSANGVAWTTLASVANPIATTDLTLLIGADTFLTLSEAKTVVFGQVAAPVLT